MHFPNLSETSGNYSSWQVSIFSVKVAEISKLFSTILENSKDWSVSELSHARGFIAILEDIRFRFLFAVFWKYIELHWDLIFNFFKNVCLIFQGVFSRRTSLKNFTAGVGMVFLNHQRRMVDVKNQKFLQELCWTTFWMNLLIMWSKDLNQWENLDLLNCKTKIFMLIKNFQWKDFNLWMSIKTLD